MLEEASGKLLVGGDGLDEVLLGFFPEAGEVPELPLFGELRDVGHCLDLELLPEEADFFRAQPLHLEHIEHSGRILLQQLLVFRVLPGFQDFADVLVHPLADAGDFLEPARFGHLGDGLGQGFNLLSGALVAAVAPDLRPVHFKQLRRLPQYPGYIPVGHRE